MLETESPPAPKIRENSWIQGKILNSPDFPPEFRRKFSFFTRGKCHHLYSSGDSNKLLFSRLSYSKFSAKKIWKPRIFSEKKLIAPKLFPKSLVPSKFFLNLGPKSMWVFPQIFHINTNDLLRQITPLLIALNKYVRFSSFWRLSLSADWQLIIFFTTLILGPSMCGLFLKFH